MNLTYKKGNLLDCSESFILHGCNAQGKMNSGVAKAIREHYPSAYAVYMHQYEKGENWLGSSTFAYQEDGKYVINGITQQYYGYDGKQYVNYGAIREVVEGINWWMEEEHGYYYPVAIPKIGAGLGGGDWDLIEKIFKETAKFDVVVYEL